MARAFTDRGGAYAFAGEERPWPPDLVPRILDAPEWVLRFGRGRAPYFTSPISWQSAMYLDVQICLTV